MSPGSIKRSIFFMRAKNYPKFYNQPPELLINNFSDFIVKKESPQEIIALLYHIKVQLKEEMPENIHLVLPKYFKVAFENYETVKASIKNLDADTFVGMLAVYSAFDIRDSIDFILEHFYDLIK